jgi:uncharacterized protein YegJ (DUF2314 family)
MPATKRPTKKTPSRAESSTSDRKLYGGLAVVVGALAALVWWSLPGNHAVPPESETPTTATGEDEPTDEAGSKAKVGAFDRPPAASAELAVITDRPEEIVKNLSIVAALAKHLDVRHCGDACDAVQKFMADKEAFEIEVHKTDDLILPPKDTLDTIAVGLTPAQREGVHARPWSAVIRTQGKAYPEQLPARAAFAAAALLAEQLDGLVYDEAARRIETPEEIVSHTVTAKLGEPAFVRKHIVVQLYRQDDGTARLLTLGMARFGSPDISIRGANMSSGPLLAELINVVASQIAHGTNVGPLTVTLADVARSVGRKPSELNQSPDAARPVHLDVVEPERIEGDPDNEMIELVPEEGASRESWDAVVASLFGMPPSVTTHIDDKELGEIAKKAQRELPKAIQRFEAGEGELYLKGPFPIPAEARADGGASTELLWIAVASCNGQLCTGVLSNEPSYATNIALGKTTSVKRTEAVDWMIHRKDGGTAGGESIKVLRARAPR